MLIHGLFRYLGSLGSQRFKRFTWFTHMHNTLYFKGLTCELAGSQLVHNSFIPMENALYLKGLSCELPGTHPAATCEPVNRE